MPPDADKAGGPRVPEVYTHIHILKSSGTRVRPEKAMYEYAEYMLGEGKGPDGKDPKLFSREAETQSERDELAAFARSWMAQKSQGRTRMDRTLEDARAAFLMRVDLSSSMLSGSETQAYRWTVAPDPKMSMRIDMRQYIELLMANVEADLFGKYAHQRNKSDYYKLVWGAVIHGDTEKDVLLDRPRQHAHVGIRGAVEHKIGSSTALEAFRMPAGYRTRGLQLRARWTAWQLLQAARRTA